MQVKILGVYAFFFLALFFLTGVKVQAVTPLPSLQNGPVLQIGVVDKVTPGQVITVPISYQGNGFAIAATSFSLNIDQSCLAIDPTDQNKDGRPDAIVFHVPAGLSAAVAINLQDADGELDFIIADYFPPFVTLPNRAPLVDIRMRAICQPEPGTTRSAALLFAADPAPSFGSTTGASVPGSAINGAVTIVGPAVPATSTPTATPPGIPTVALTATPTLIATMPSSTPALTPVLTPLPTAPAATVIEHFSATSDDTHIQLSWQTHSEAATAGFYLYRKQIDAQSPTFDFQPLTTLVSAQGTEGGMYLFTDGDVQPEARYLYLLVEEKQSGARIDYIDLIVTTSLGSKPPYQILLPLVWR